MNIVAAQHTGLQTHNFVRIFSASADNKKSLGSSNSINNDDGFRGAWRDRRFTLVVLKLGYGLNEVFCKDGCLVLVLQGIKHRFSKNVFTFRQDDATLFFEFCADILRKKNLRFNRQHDKPPNIPIVNYYWLQNACKGGIR